MRDIVKGEGLNIMLNEIVDYEMDKTLDEMILAVEDWKKTSNVVSCETVIKMIKAKKSK